MLGRGELTQSLPIPYVTKQLITRMSWRWQIKSFYREIHFWWTKLCLFFFCFPQMKYCLLMLFRPLSSFSVQGMINEGVQVVVTVLRCHQKRAVSAITESSQIPHLSLDLDPCKSSDSEEFTLHLTQQYNNMAAVLLDIILATDVTQITLDFQTVFRNIFTQKMS